MEVKIRCQGAVNLHPSLLKEFQGELKDLSMDNFEKLKKQILDLGFSEPISVWKNNGEYNVLNGHQRLRVIKKLLDQGYLIPDLPCNLIEADNEYQAKQKVLALTSQFGEITDDGLYEFISLANIPIENLDEDYRFPEIDLDKFLDQFKEVDKSKEENEDEVTDVKDTRCKLGDLFELGDHRLLCGDSTNKELVDRLMNGQIVDITFTSPPYNIGRSKGGSGGHIKYSEYSDCLSDNDYFNLLNCFLKIAQSISKYQFINLQFLNCNRISMINWIYNYRDNLKEIMVWYKKHGSITPDYVLHSAYENIFIFDSLTVENRAINLNSKLKGITNVIEKEHGMIQTREHKAGFPVYLPEKIINIFNINKIYEPFCGTGSTLIACEKTKTKCYGMELSPLYCDVIINRWQEYSGKKAYKLNDDGTKTLYNEMICDTIPSELGS